VTERQAVPGKRPGDGYVRIRREDLGVFRRTAQGHLVATPEASAPPGPFAGATARVRDVLIGRPLDSEAIGTERLSVFKALPILSSDALSSVAYGPEAALAVLVVAGTGALFWNVPIAVAVALLMLIVTFSYQQVIRGHPGGGGSYAVARANLGVVFGLVAAAAPLVDYVLTVSVSVSSGVDALISPFLGLAPYRAEISIALVAIIMVGNLRGVREAGVLFAVPTYLFIVVTLTLIGAGLLKAALGGAPHSGQYPPIPATESLTPLLVLAAFASGCSSMTGIEAVSNSVPSFYEPRVSNAIRTLATLGGLLVLLFVGVEVLDVLYAAVPQPGGSPTVLSQIAAAVFTGPSRWLYYCVQFSTTLVLVLAANTSFNGFPRLCGILAHDDFLPHQFALLGNRLVYSAAIVFLAVAATILMLAFSGNTEALINLFALGVFTAFSLAQTAMARNWWTRREPGWMRGFAINGTGAVVTALVDAVIIATKTPRGAWVVVVLVPVLVLGFMAIHRYYTSIQAQVERIPPSTDVKRLGLTIVPVRRWNSAAADAVAYARTLRGSAVALLCHGAGGPADAPPDVEMRELSERGIDPLLREIDAIRLAPGAGVVTVVLPDEALPLLAQVVLRPTLVRLKLALLGRTNVVAASCPRFRSTKPVEAPHMAFVPITGVDAITVNALGYARALGGKVVAIHVVTDVEHVARDEPDEVPDEFKRWADQLEGEMPELVVIESPYRAVMPPVISYVMQWRDRHAGHPCTVVIPELVDRRLWTQWLHNHRAFWLKATLLRQPGIGVADVTFHLREAE
jgi:amino acid transporter